MNELKKFFVLGLPQKEDRCPNALYIVKTDVDKVEIFFTDRLKNALKPDFKVNQEGEPGEVEVDLTSTMGTIEVINVGGNTNIEVAQYILNALTNEVEYAEPSASLSLGETLVEAGTTVKRIVTSTFIQNDAGLVNRQRIRRGKIIILDSFSTDLVKTVDDAVTVNRGSIDYISLIDYNKGPIKENNLGQPDATNRIPKGSIERTVSINGRLKMFYKTASSFSQDGEELRQTATGSVFDNSNSFSFIVSGTHTSIALPIDKDVSNIEIKTSNDEDITLNFTNTESSINIPDAGFNLQPYRIYNYSSGVPLNAKITITL
jgi:hypothetical protein